MATDEDKIFLETLGDEYRVVFDKWEIVDEAERLILVQFRDKPVFVAFVRSLLTSCENLTDTLTAWARIRTAFEAEGENLNALGRIVGAERGRPFVDGSDWFRPDDDERTVDIAPLWVPGTIGFLAVNWTDDEYRYFIIAKAIRNHIQYGSIPEITRMIKLLTGLEVKIVKTGPDEITVIALGATRYQSYILGLSETNNNYDDFWIPPYPAGVSVRSVIMTHEQLDDSGLSI